MATINPLPNPLIRKYKANDPYYYEVDNLPLEQLQTNDNTLDGNIKAVNEDLTLRPTETEVDAKIGAQYFKTQAWAEGLFFDAYELFTGQVPGLVYRQDEIDWTTAYTDVNRFTDFYKEKIGRTNDFPPIKGGPWTWSWQAGHVLDFFYSMEEIDTITFDVSRLSTDDVDAIVDRTNALDNDPNTTPDTDPDAANPFTTKGEITTYVTPDESGALHTASAPSIANPFATVDDVTSAIEQSGVIHFLGQPKVIYGSTPTKTGGQSSAESPFTDGQNKSVSVPTGTSINDVATTANQVLVMFSFTCLGGFGNVSFFSFSVLNENDTVMGRMIGWTRDTSYTTLYASAEIWCPLLDDGFGNKSIVVYSSVHPSGDGNSDLSAQVVAYST